MRSRSTVPLVIAFCVLVSAAAARAGEWQRMGQEYVDFRSNPVVVSVSPEAGAVSKIKIQVKENALELSDVKVFLAGGQSFEVALKAFLAAGDESRVIDVPGGSQAIEKVEVRYHNRSDEEPMPLLRVLGAS